MSAAAAAGVIVGAILSALVVAPFAAGLTRLIRTGRDRRDAEAKAIHFRKLWWQQLGALCGKPLGLLIAAVLILATLALIAGGKQ